MTCPVVTVLAVLALPFGACAAPTADPDDGPRPQSDSTAAADGHNEWDVTRLPDPCRVVTRAEAEHLVGQPMQEGERLQTWPPLCALRMPGPPESFLYVSDDAGTTGRESFDRQRSDSASVEPVTGLGSEAYWAQEFGALHVWDGGTHVTVKFAGAVPADTLAKATAIARVILPRLAPGPTPTR